MGKLISQIFSMIALITFLGILLGIPYYIFSEFFNTVSNFISSTKEQLKKPEAQNIIINSQYGSFNGQMDNQGLALAIIQVDRASSFKVKDHFNVNELVKPYKNGTDLVIISLLCQNNSHLIGKDDDHMIPSVNEFKLIGKQEYRIDIMAMTQLQSYGHGNVTPLVLDINDSKLMLLAFDIQPDEYIYDMTLQYGNPYTFNANIQLPIR